MNCYKSISTSMRAFKIVAMYTQSDGGAVLTDEAGKGEIVSQEYLSWARPQVGGYFTVSDSGRESWMSEREFEANYEQID